MNNQDSNTPHKHCPHCQKKIGPKGAQGWMTLGLIVAVFLFAGALIDRTEIAKKVSHGMSWNDFEWIFGEDERDEQNSVAEVTVAKSEEETRLLKDFYCKNETQCFGLKKFNRYVFSRFPDLTAIRANPIGDLGEHHQGLDTDKLDFYRALYFAKLIKLADGLTLFDFMRQCSKGFTPLDEAQMSWDKSVREGESNPYIEMQFFPVLRKKGTGEEYEMQILLERREDKIIAQTPWFSSDIFRHSDFMNRNGLECWKH
jgi:hypothetical protein